MTVDVSVCIVNWNGRKLLRDLLDSLRSAEPNLPIETIVVDNASADGSADMVAADFTEVRLIRNEQNLGFAVANNQAADIASGKYLFFLNNDTVVLPGAIGKLVRYLDAHPECSAAGPKLIGSDGRPQQSGRNLPTLRALLYQRMQLFPCWTGLFKRAYRHYRYGSFDTATSGPIPQLAAAALLVRRDVFEKAGRWDEGFNFGVEDVDLCVRLGKFGPIQYLADAEIRHLGRISSRANRGFVYTGYECGYARYLSKHRSRNIARLYKLAVTFDMPARLLVMGFQTYGYRLIGRKDAYERTRGKLAAGGEFFFHRMPKFWRS